MNGFEDERDPGTAPRPPGNVLWLFGQMFFIPFRTFMYAIEMLLDGMRGFPKARHDEISKGVQQLTSQLGAAPQVEEVRRPSAQPADLNENAASSNAKTELKETKVMDKNLNDDMLKLVRYRIIFVKRDEETSYDQRDELVHDNLNPEAYTAWKIAEFTKTPEGGKYSKEDQKYLRVFYEVLERYPREKFKYEEDQIDLLKDQNAILEKIEKKMK